MDYLEKYALWLKSVPEEDPLHRELEEMQGDDALIRERFMKDIAFGTAGLRGILGAGTSCMNRYTVGRAAQGIANLICEEGPEGMEKGVVIAHDPRHGSKEFSGLAADHALFRVFLVPAFAVHVSAVSQLGTFGDFIRDSFGFFLGLFRFVEIDLLEGGLFSQRGCVNISGHDLRSKRKRYQCRHEDA